VPILLWDASALVKRYVAETGNDTINSLFAPMPLPRMAITFWGYVETYAILVRKHNEGHLDATAFSAALSALYNEVILSGDFDLLSIDDEAVMNSVTHILTHHINTNDAALLTVYLDYSTNLPSGSPACLVISSDHRFLRAASAEGFATLNPETFAAADVPALLASIP
jgi:hypothetical protein